MTDFPRIRKNPLQTGANSGACEALDHMDVNGMVGTLAGENTVFVVMKDNACAETFCQEIREML